MTTRTARSTLRQCAANGETRQGIEPLLPLDYSGFASHIQRDRRLDGVRGENASKDSHAQSLLLKRCRYRYRPDCNGANLSAEPVGATAPLTS